MNYSLIEDLSELTYIPKKTLEKLATYSTLLISQCVKERQKAKETTTIVDIGLGLLYINIDEKEVRYKFIPDKGFIMKINKTLEGKEEPLVQAIEDSITKKFNTIYKELL